MPGFEQRLDEALKDAGRRGLSQNEVGRRIGATSNTRLSEWKTGKGSPTVVELVALASELEVRLEWLAAGVPPKEPTAPDEREYRLAVIQMTANGEIPLATLRQILEDRRGADEAEADRVAGEAGSSAPATGKQLHGAGGASP